MGHLYILKIVCLARGPLYNPASKERVDDADNPFENLVYFRDRYRGLEEVGDNDKGLADLGEDLEGLEKVSDWREGLKEVGDEDEGLKELGEDLEGL